MKKVIFFATAAAVAVSTLTPAFASAPTRSYYNGEYNTNDLGAFGLPKQDKVTVGLDIRSKWTEASSYTDHSRVALSKRVSRSTGSATFDSMAYLDMQNVASEWNEYIDAALESELGQNAVSSPEQLRAMIMQLTELNGEFDIVITVPQSYEEDVLAGIDNAALVSGATASETTYTWPENTMGYSVTDFFEFKSSERTTDAEAGTLTYTITMVTKDGINSALDEYFAAIAAAEDKDAYRLELVIPNNTVGTVTARSYEINGAFSGSVTIDTTAFSKSGDTYTVFFGDDDNYEDFTTIAPVTDTELVRLTTGGGGGGGGGATGTTQTPVPGTTATPAASETPAATTEPGTTPEPGTSATHTPAPVVTPSSGAQLNYDDHYAYIIGYPAENGEEIREVRPQNNITRAEVATIFFRMFTDDTRAQYWTKSNSFNDVVLSDWFNNAISTAANAGIVNGDPSGNFRPNDAITRAELATIASRFSSEEYTGESMFTDIAGHWAEDAINKAAQVGWVTGYGDGTFKPDTYITRAEAMTLINRLLYRLVDDEGVGNIDGMVVWSDNPSGTWYYAAVQEATNSHYYEREAIGHYETWTQIREPRDWEALEKTYSEVTDAGQEESVFFDETDTPDATLEPVTSDELTAEEGTTSTETPEVSESPAPTETAE